MNISFNTTQFADISETSRIAVEVKLRPIERLLASDKDVALLDVELAHAPPEGRSATPVRLTATLQFKNYVLHAEAVKPTPESAADRVRSALEQEIRRVRGKKRGLVKRGAAQLKKMLRFGA